MKAGICRRGCRLLFYAALFTLSLNPAEVAAQSADSILTAQALKRLSIEELMNIEVTLVSRAPVKLTEVASAIQVITREEILRSGATNVPEALRLASNLQVAQFNSNTWLISARGFNTIFANKLLVMIDGRTVYTPLFGGVLWALQNVLLEDIDRIEVVSGPGGSLWGANAVNGIINIMTRSAAETDGAYVSAQAGNFLRHSVAARYGGKFSKNLSYRVYAQNFNRDNTSQTSGIDNFDQWQLWQTGFRMDWKASGRDELTFQGDLYQGKRKTAPDDSPFDGQNVMARWTHSYSQTSNFIAQVYFDRYWYYDVAQPAPGMVQTLADQLQTIDFDFQHQFRLGKAHDLVWGFDYRNVNDHFYNFNVLAGILPPRKNLDLVSAFVQDIIAVSDKTQFTAGLKVLHNVYSDIELHPSIRLSYAVTPGSLVWAAVSQGVRVPSRFDVDYYLPLPPVPAGTPRVAGGPNFESETVLAYEAGYRLQLNAKSTFSIAGFYNSYDDLYSVEVVPETVLVQIQNGSEGESWGAEFTGSYQIFDRWRVSAGYTYFDKDLRSKPGHVFDPAYLGNDSRNHATFQSMLNLPHGITFDVAARYLDYLPKTAVTDQVPEYFTFDARIALRLKHFEFALVGQNLPQEDHVEFGNFTTKRSTYGRIPRSFYGQITCRF